MNKFIYAVPLLFLLTACEHSLYLANRKSGEIAKGTVTTIPGQHSGDISIVLKGQTYNGRWIYMQNGGAVGFGTATAFSGGYSAYGTSTMTMQSTQGGGTILASTSDGSNLRCNYLYNEWGSSGVGTCKTNLSDEYDLQIN